jgi:hypothetical protein
MRRDGPMRAIQSGIASPGITGSSELLQRRPGHGEPTFAERTLRFWSYRYHTVAGRLAFGLTRSYFPTCVKDVRKPLSSAGM